MKKTTVTLPAIYMSREEQNALWHAMHNTKRELWEEKFGIIDWNTDDGNNDIRFSGEDFYRIVTHTDNG